MPTPSVYSEQMRWQKLVRATGEVDGGGPVRLHTRKIGQRVVALRRARHQHHQQPAARVPLERQYQQ